MGKLDDAGRAIAGLLTYNPGPGIYSRLERAIEAMPENVRVQELPGLLKRYKDGVPGWELKETDLDSVIAGRDVVPREELLARVKERSPVYTHREVVLGGAPQTEQRRAYVPVPGHAGLTQAGMARVNDYQQSPSSLGRGVSHGEAAFEHYGQGGDQYGEIVLLSPEARQAGWGQNVHHFHKDYPAMRGRAMSPEVRDALTGGGAAHARLGTHGDALRINELQSDLGIHNRKVREAVAGYKSPPEQLPGESNSAYLDRAQEQGYVMQMGDDGRWMWGNDPRQQGIPFPLEDSWSDLLIKRLALEAARKGHRAIEVASPRAIADKVGGNIENYEHFYGKVVPGALERLGRKMGGLVEDTDQATVLAASRVRGDGTESAAALDRMVELADLPDIEGTKLSGKRQAAERLLGDLGRVIYGESHGGGLWNTVGDFPAMKMNMANNLSALVGHNRMNEMFLRANELAASHAARRHADNMVTDTPLPPSMNPAGKRYIMSDEMRRRIIEQGIGASLLAPLLAPAGDE
jgi:hypothetical protein